MSLFKRSAKVERYKSKSFHGVLAVDEEKFARVDLSTPTKSKTPSSIVTTKSPGDLTGAVKTNFDDRLGHISDLNKHCFYTSENVIPGRKAVINWIHIEKRVNTFVMFIVLLDTVVLALETTETVKPSDTWILILSNLFIFAYWTEVGFRIFIANPTGAFFHKRF